MPAQQFEVREALSADAAAIADIARQWNSSDPSFWRSSEDIRGQIEGFGSGEAYLLLQKNGVILGWGLVRLYSDRLGYRFCAEVSLCVRRSETRSGHGSRLEEALIEYCSRYGYHHLLLRTYADNRACLGFHEQKGYRMVGIQNQICFQDGWRDVVILERILETIPPPGP